LIKADGTFAAESEGLEGAVAESGGIIRMFHIGSWFVAMRRSCFSCFTFGLFYCPLI
jgi:hypothetical protein